MAMKTADLSQSELERVLSVKALKSALRKQLRKALGFHEAYTDSYQGHPEFQKLKDLLHGGTQPSESINVLDSWSMYFLVRFDNWLELGMTNQFFDKKNEAVQKLKQALDDDVVSTEDILVSLLISVLKPEAKPGYHNPLTLQAAIGHFAHCLYPVFNDDPFNGHWTAIHLASSIFALGSGVKMEDSDNAHVVYSIYRREEQMAQVTCHQYDTLVKLVTTENGELPELINTSFFNPPLVEPPKPVTSIESTGYHEFNNPTIVGNLPNFSPVQLDRKLRKDGKRPINYCPDVLNQLNAIRWRIDPDVANEAMSLAKEALPDNLDDPGFIPFRNMLITKLGDRPLWFTWEYESRLRILMHGYHLNLQSFKSNRALLSFDRYEYLD